MAVGDLDRGALHGCGGVPDAGSGAAPAGPGDEIASSQSALGETTCGDVTCPTTGKCAEVDARLSCARPTANATSPDASYGESACPAQFIVSATEVPNATQVTAFVDWGDTALTKAECPQATLEISLLRTPTFVSPAGWTEVGWLKFKGSWEGTFCHLWAVNGAGSLSFSNSAFSPYAWRATGAARLNGVKKKVTVGFFVQVPPC
jgi:hypothetical protein